MLNDFITNFALQVINSNPNIANNPRNKELISIIQNGDAVRGQQIAENLCNTYGVPRNQAVANAKSFFNIH